MLPHRSQWYERPSHDSGSFVGASTFIPGSGRIRPSRLIDANGPIFGAKNELVDESHAISVSARLFHARIDGDSSKSSEPGRQP